MLPGFHLRVSLALAVAAAACCIGVATALAGGSSSVSVKFPAGIHTGKTFTLTVTGRAYAPFPQGAMSRVLVYAASYPSSAPRPDCLQEEPVTVSANPSYGTVLAEFDVKPGGVHKSVPTKLPQVGRWVVCASVVGEGSVQGAGTTALKPKAAVVAVTNV